MTIQRRTATLGPLSDPRAAWRRSLTSSPSRSKRAGHAVPTASALAELEAGDLDDLDPGLAHLGDGVGVALVGDDHAGLEGDDVVAVVPLLPLLLVLRRRRSRRRGASGTPSASATAPMKSGSAVTWKLALLRCRAAG